MADELVALLFPLRFPQEQMKNREDVLALPLKGHQAITVVLIVRRREFQPLNTQNDIFQRTVVAAELGVLHIGIDDHQIVSADREKFPLYLKLANAADHIKKLGAVMGVYGAVPIPAVLRGADIQELAGGVTAVNGLRVKIQQISFGAQGLHPPEFINLAENVVAIIIHIKEKRNTKNKKAVCSGRKKAMSREFEKGQAKDYCSAKCTKNNSKNRHKYSLSP